MTDQAPTPDAQLQNSSESLNKLLLDMQAQFADFCKERLAMKAKYEELDKLIPTLQQLIPRVNVLAAQTLQLMHEHEAKHLPLPIVPVGTRPSVDSKPTETTINKVWCDGSTPRPIGTEINPRD